MDRRVDSGVHVLIYNNRWTDGWTVVYMYWFIITDGPTGVHVLIYNDTSAYYVHVVYHENHIDTEYCITRIYEYILANHVNDNRTNMMLL